MTLTSKIIEQAINEALFECLFGSHTSVQTLIFKKSNFNSSSAKKWAKGHGFKNSKVDETSKSFRLRQFPPIQCKKGSHSTIKMRTGVSAVICRKRG